MGMIKLNLGAPQEAAIFDTEGAAEYLGCSPGYLKTLRQSGEGPDYHRLGRRKGIRYSSSQLNKWLASRTFGSTTEYPETLP